VLHVTDAPLLYVTSHCNTFLHTPSCECTTLLYTCHAASASSFPSRSTLIHNSFVLYTLHYFTALHISSQYCTSSHHWLRHKADQLDRKCCLPGEYPVEDGWARVSASDVLTSFGLCPDKIKNKIKIKIKMSMKMRINE
jgi:hypothetical protein